MTTERRPVTIHYRRFSRPATLPSTLEHLVRTAMNTNEDGVLIKDRYLARTLKQQNDNYFINIFTDQSPSNSLVFGDILHFTKGHLQALCKTADDKAPFVAVQQMKAPEQSEYVHSQMFWMIKDDHAFVLQSMSLRTEEFERYLNWLLKSKTSQLPADHMVTLTAKFDEEEVGGDLGDIQEIIVGGIATPLSIKGSEETTEKVREITQHGQIDTGRKAGWDTATNILRELLGGDANVESLMRAVPADAELRVQVHIGYQTKKRKVDRVALQQLETGLRNLPDSQLQVKAKGTKVAADGSIRLHHNASIRLLSAQDGDKQIIGTLLDPADVQRAMYEAYATFIANGKIKE